MQQGFLGGPLKLPGLWTDSVKTYFYVDVEGLEAPRPWGLVRSLPTSLSSGAGTRGAVE
jgi:hypothetical protein